jgi:hypothetical protein
MIDKYLVTLTEAEMNAALINAGIAYEDDGVLYPAGDVSLDVIGPFSKWDYSVEPPVEVNYPEWHVNIRASSLDDDQLAILDPISVEPPVPYRVFA